MVSLPNSCILMPRRSMDCAYDLLPSMAACVLCTTLRMARSNTLCATPASRATSRNTMNSLTVVRVRVARSLISEPNAMVFLTSAVIPVIPNAPANNPLTLPANLAVCPRNFSSSLTYLVPSAEILTFKLICFFLLLFALF